MTRILAIDPGNTESGWAIIRTAACDVVRSGKSDNDEVLSLISEQGHSLLAIEMVASYGMPVGRDVFETCVWIGRFLQHDRAEGGIPANLTLDELATTQQLVYRRDVKLHHCHTSKAKDSNVRQALVDRFAAGQPNHGKGTKAAPGWFYGFRADIWQAYALAVYAADLLFTEEVA